MVEKLHMLAQSWPNFKNLESLHSTVLYSISTKKGLPFRFFGIFKMSINAVMQRESFSDSCVNTCSKWLSVAFPQKSEIPNTNIVRMLQVYKVKFVHFVQIFVIQGPVIFKIATNIYFQYTF